MLISFKSQSRLTILARRLRRWRILIGVTAAVYRYRRDLIVLEIQGETLVREPDISFFIDVSDVSNRLEVRKNATYVVPKQRHSGEIYGRFGCQLQKLQVAVPIEVGLYTYVTVLVDQWPVTLFGNPSRRCIQRVLNLFPVHSKGQRTDPDERPKSPRHHANCHSRPARWSIDYVVSMRRLDVNPSDVGALKLVLSSEPRYTSALDRLPAT